MKDPIVAEVRKHRMEHTKRFHGDLTAICEKLEADSKNVWMSGCPSPNEEAENAKKRDRQIDCRCRRDHLFFHGLFPRSKGRSLQNNAKRCCKKISGHDFLKKGSFFSGIECSRNTCPLDIGFRTAAALAFVRGIRPFHDFVFMKKAASGCVHPAVRNGSDGFPFHIF